VADILRFRDLTLGYDGHPAVHHLSGDIPQGDLLAVCGPNGSGKSTLLKGVAGVLSPLGGRIERGGAAGRAIAFLPQAAEIDRAFPIDVHDFVLAGLWRETGPFRALTRAHRHRIDDALATVGLTGFERRMIDTLSGGQMQRMLFARLLLQDAPLILLDEPFTAVDDRTAGDLLTVIARWRAEGRTVLAVLHDFETVRRHFPRTLLLARETIAWGPTREALSADNLARARRMIEVFDAEAHACERAA
jgi:zinc/manganese transport system ATP-binding protein